MKHSKPSKQQTGATWDNTPLNWDLQPLPAWDLALPEPLFTDLPNWDLSGLPHWDETTLQAWPIQQLPAWDDIELKTWDQNPTKPTP
jgi:hypothetical protein